jgi:phenylacetate-coenzyme A ligase PaaK-like adenylate-forming protein
VVTPLFNYAMPLIRYELGDMAEVGTASPLCGRGLPTLRRILGRYRNMFRYRDGSTSWPAATGFRLANFIALRQFQVVQTDFNHVEIRYVADDDAAGRPIDLAALTERVRRVLRQPVDVSVRRVSQIERSSNGKYEDCISLVASDGVDATPSILKKKA